MTQSEDIDTPPAPAPLFRALSHTEPDSPQSIAEDDSQFALQQCRDTDFYRYVPAASFYDLPPPCAMARQTDGEVDLQTASTFRPNPFHWNQPLADSIFGEPPAMVRQFAVDGINLQAVDHVRLYGLYNYLLTNDIRQACNDREIMLAQLEYLEVNSA